MKKYHKHFKAVMATRPDGFFRQMARNTAVFYKRSPTRLIVTFDNMKSREGPKPLFPWGYKYLESLGVSHLGIMMSRRNDWFRHEDVQALFDELRDDGFFAGFDEVIFFGSSMGGYGALAYAPAAPGCRVVALMPQTHLDPAVVPFEQRFRNGFRRGNWDGPCADGAVGARAASKVYVLYDPYYDLDADHVARLDGANLVHIRLFWAGHQATRVLHTMGLLAAVTKQAFDGTLTTDSARVMIRDCNRSALGVRHSLGTALVRGHAKLVLRTLQSLEVSHPEWRFPKVKAKARALR